MSSMTREVEVRPRVIGTFAPGYRIADVQAEPAQDIDQRSEAAGAGGRGRDDRPGGCSGTMVRGSFMTNTFVSDPLVQVVRPGAHPGDGDHGKDCGRTPG